MYGTPGIGLMKVGKKDDESTKSIEGKTDAASRGTNHMFW